MNALEMNTKGFFLDNTNVFSINFDIKVFKCDKETIVFNTINIETYTYYLFAT